MTKQKIQKMIAVLCIAAAAVWYLACSTYQSRMGQRARKFCSSSASRHF